MFSIDSQDLNPGNQTGSFVISKSANTTLYSSSKYQINLVAKTDFGIVSKILNITGFNPSDGDGLLATNGLSTNSNYINLIRNGSLGIRSNTYSLLYSVLSSGIEQEKPIGVELSYYAGITGNTSGYKGDIEISNSGSGFHTGDAYFYVTGANGSGFVAQVESDWTYPSPGPNRGTGNIKGINVINFGQDYQNTTEISGYISGNTGSGGAHISPIATDYSKPFFETWNLQTGLSTIDMFSFSGNSLSGAPLEDTSVYSDPNFSGGNQLLDSNTTSLFIQVDWEPLFDTNAVVAKLEITGEGFNFIEYITGQR